MSEITKAAAAVTILAIVLTPIVIIIVILAWPPKRKKIVKVLRWLAGATIVFWWISIFMIGYEARPHNFKFEIWIWGGTIIDPLVVFISVRTLLMFKDILPQSREYNALLGGLSGIILLILMGVVFGLGLFAGGNLAQLHSS